MRILNPADPKVKTFGLRAPLQTHFRPASCEDADCANHRNGFLVRLDVNLQDQLVADVRRLRPGQFTEWTENGIITFQFPPGTRCFQKHTRSLEREPLYVVRDKDGGRRHQNGDNWVDEFATNQIKLIEKIQEG